MMKRVFSRGLNYHGQCGLGKEIMHSVEMFSEINLPYPIKNVYASQAHSIALHEDSKTVFFWGFNWDIRSFMRTAAIFQFVPRFMRAMKLVWPPLKSFPNSPSLLHEFPNKLKDVSLGGAHCIFLDETGTCFVIGDNTSGQLGRKELQPFFAIERLDIHENMLFDKISAGYQHSLFLTKEGSVIGCGKCDKMQLGNDYVNKYHNHPSYKDEGLGLVELDLKSVEGRIVDVAAGKYHSAFLTDKGDVYVLGVNRFGQLGESNMNKHMTSVPIKVEFPHDVKIVDLKVGDNHNLMLASDGTLYANGDNSAGQVDGDLDNFLYYNCTPKKVPLPEEAGQNNKIVKIYAKCNRSAALLENGNFYYWGGFSYHSQYYINIQPKYEGFSLFNTESGIPENSKIVDVGLGFLHDIVLIQNI